MIAKNLETVRTRIAAACERSGRSVDSVKLIAVSKTKPVSDILEAVSCGQMVFGENRVQELCEKMDVLEKNGLEWHQIGHLQRNKVKYLIGRVDLIHAVDSLRLAEQISAEAGRVGRVMPVLLEVNAAKEATKFGFLPEETIPAAETIAGLPNVCIKGLMTIAPYTENPEENRKYFKKMYQLYVDIRGKNIDNIDMVELSMGMTGDYEVAIEEGATMVRVGTGIFGGR